MAKNLKCLPFGDRTFLSIIMVWWMDMECLSLELPGLIEHWLNCFCLTCLSFLFSSRDHLYWGHLWEKIRAVAIFILFFVKQHYFLKGYASQVQLLVRSGYSRLNIDCVCTSSESEHLLSLSMPQCPPCEFVVSNPWLAKKLYGNVSQDQEVIHESVLIRHGDHFPAVREYARECC